MSKDNTLADLFSALHHLAPQDSDTRMKIAEFIGIQAFAKKQPTVHDKLPEKAKVTPPTSINNGNITDRQEPAKTTKKPQAIESIFTTISSGSAAQPYWLASANKIAREQPSSKKQPLPFSPLLKQEWTRAILSRVVAITRKQPQPDIDQLIKKMVKVEPVVHIPNKEQLVSAPSIQLLIDKSEGMELFSLDQTNITRRIKALCGKDHLRLLTFNENPWLAEDPFALQPLNTDVSVISSNNNTPTLSAPKKLKLSPYSVVLALTDFGANAKWPAASKQRLEYWQTYAAALAKIDCRLIILTPFPPTQWPAMDTASMKVIHWDRRTNLSNVIQTMQRREKR